MNKHIIIISLFILLYSCNDANEKSGAQPLSKTPPFLILNSAGGLGAYTGELLKAEGFNEYDLINADQETITLKMLESYDWVILPQIDISDSLLRDIGKYVEKGGNLVSFLPPAGLLQLLDAGTIADTLNGGYIQINTTTQIGRGLIPVPLKFHGNAILVNESKKDVDVIASFRQKNVLQKQWPAVFFKDNGVGHALCFLYDLPKNILYTRQGNPAYANKETDGIFGIRATDLFTNNWVDTSMNNINPADEQLRLLTHGIELLSHNKKPLPRFWYFPDTLTCLATLTNDWENFKQKDFTQQLQDISAKGATMSLYTLHPDKISRSFVDSLAGRGYEIAAHPDATRYADRPSWPIMTLAVRDKLAELETIHGITDITTNANHWFVWCGTDDAGNPDFAAQAKIESNFGIRLDLNFAHYDNNSNQQHFLGALGNRQGNFEGSGLPLRFADVKGKVVDIFQHFTNVYDQQYMEHRDSVGFFECFKGLVDRSMDDEVYSYVSVKAHTIEYFFSRTPLMQMLDYARQRNVPVWTAASLYKFLKTKDEASFSDFNFKRGTLFFTIHFNEHNPNGLTFLVPDHFNGKSITMITGNEQLYPVIKKKIKGITYAWVTIQPGKQYAFRVSYK